ncbi:hypothetical protein HAHE_02200 [Haloferula helveola]|uniref:PEP-CTERM protein-sorting domain-containing protein n=1 Tax=Haloferula helveola TaxID=490095 RepID=A0ABM7RCG5_9BACT|nr:hypothetical protein HAHE_02200 [Haloferula helveola]
MKPTPASLLAVLPFLAAIGSADAAVVFADDFEAGTSGITSQQSVTATQDVLTYNVANTSRVFNGSLWVDTTNGFGSDRQGLIDGGAGGTDLGNFTPDGAGPQAYGFRYTNSGLTSDVGVIGSLALGTTITVSFDVFIDGWNGGSAYNCYLTTFDGGARTEMNGGGAIQGTTSMLASISGNAAGGAYQTVSFSYVVGNDVIDANGAAAGVSTTFDNAVLGDDIAIRFQGATSFASIDNVSVDISPAVPEARVVFLGAIGVLLLLRRRRG